MPKVLFLALHPPDRAPGQRFRFEQYLDFLQANGYEYEYSPVLKEEDYKYFYGKGYYGKKFGILWKGFWKRWHQTSGRGKYDLVFIQRECLMLGTTYFERHFARKYPIVFDFDDSIWLQVVSENNKKLGFLKNADKTARLIALSTLVFAGNEYLADYARRFNDRVVIVPTTIDTDEYKRLPQPPTDTVCIGWSGSFTTIEHFRYALPALTRLREKYGDRLRFKVIGDGNFRYEPLGIQGIAWSKADEIKELSQIDIGIMPLPDDEWTKGKCGLKGLQYMALEIATVMSPVGVNTQIIQDGSNGFLAGDTEEWVQKISRLIDDADLRRRMGAAGRQTVLESYSVLSQRDRYLQYFDQLTGRGK